MLLSDVVVLNYKSIVYAHLHLGKLQALVGENNAGKSNILEAIALFLGGSSAGLDEECFYDKSKPIWVRITFDNIGKPRNEKFLKWIFGDSARVAMRIRWDQDKGRASSADYFGYRREPIDDRLKESKVNEWGAEELEQIVKDLGLPESFRRQDGRVTKTTFEKGLRRYLAEHAEVSFGRWVRHKKGKPLGWSQVLKGQFPEPIMVEAVRHYKEESKHSGSAALHKIEQEIARRIAETDPQLQEISTKLDLLKKALNPPEQEQADERPKAVRDVERTLTTYVQEMMPEVQRVVIGYVLEDAQELLESRMTVRIHDGWETSVEVKGHGLQRATIVAMLRLLAGMDREGKATPMVFLMENPELYLHPHRQRTFARVVRELSRDYQIVFCTHSAYFLDLNNYRQICIVEKPEPDVGTKVKQCLQALFPGEEEEHFKLLNFCDPARSELFFARKVILVEGPADEIAVRLILTHCGKFQDLDDKGITLFHCEGKPNIPRFMRLLNAFRIPYVVLHDIEPGKPLEEKVNDRIQTECDPTIGQVITIDPDLEQASGYPGKFDRLSAFTHFSDPDNIDSGLRAKCLSLIG